MSDDRALIARFLTRESAAVAELTGRVAAAAEAALRSGVSGLLPDDVRDLVQDTWFKFESRIHDELSRDLAELGSIVAWVTVTARRAAFKYVKKARKRRTVEMVGANPARPDERHVPDPGCFACIRDVVAQADKVSQDIWNLRFASDVSWQGIAEEVGLTVGQARGRLGVIREQIIRRCAKACDRPEALARLDADS